MREAQQRDPEFQNVKNSDSLNALKYAHTFDCVEELLRYFRPSYDDLSRREQAALIQGACNRINKFHEALEELTAFAEYAPYDADKGKLRKLKPARENVRRDVKASPALHQNYNQLQEEVVCSNPNYHLWHLTPNCGAKPPQAETV